MNYPKEALILNEFEKDEILEQEDETSPEKENYEKEDDEEIQEAVSSDGSDYEEAAEEDSLERELEEIRDMMQQELDKAYASSEDMVIQELEDIEYEEEDEEYVNVPLCECCEENPRGEDSPYCDECRNLMKKYPLRKSGIFTVLLMIVFFGASLYLSYPYMTDALTVADASANYNSGYTMNALQSYYAYFNGGKTGDAVSKKAFNEILEGYTKTGYHTDAANLISTYYDEDALSKPWNKKYADIVDSATILTETYQAVSDVTSAVLSGGDFDYDEVMAELDALKQVNPVEEGTSQVTTKYDEIFIEYYKYIVMSVSEKSFEEQLKQLKKIDAIGEGQEWVYLSNYCAVAAKLGDEEAVNYSYDRLLELNRQDMNAYVAKANYYRFLDTPDTDKMLEILGDAAEVAYSSDTSYKHSLAVAYLLKGEGALALEEIEALFDAGTYTVQNCNLYAVCGIYTGDNEIYNEMKSLLASYGYEISDLVTEYKKGKITLEEVLKDKGGEI